jgi:hypothetical protein
MFAVISSCKMMYFAESNYLKELGTCQRYQQLGNKSGKPELSIFIGSGAENNISSIVIPQGFMITVYDGNLTGKNRTFSSSVSNLSAYGWNDQISSVYVFRQ